MSKTIAIIGGGLSGTLVVLNAIKQSQVPLQIIWFDAQDAFCKGLAYSTEYNSHLLNVRASNMSIFPDEPHHFVNWLKSEHLPYSAHQFVPRSIFGNYVQQTFDALLYTNPLINLTLYAERVNSITQSESLYIINAHKTFQAHQVILAFGNFLPAHPRSLSFKYITSPHYFRNAFSNELLKAAINASSITIVGSGLTMIDVVLSITKHSEFKGKITVISPHGYLPQAHNENPLPPVPSYINEEKTYRLVELVALVNKQLKRAAQQHLNPHSVIDSLRPHLQRFWLNFTTDEKQQFLRHLRHKWGVARHRASSESMEVIEQLIKTNRLEILKGRIQLIEQRDNGFEINYLKTTQQVVTIQSQLLINCTGPESNLEKVESSLIQQLLNNHIITIDDIKYGVSALPNGLIKNNVYAIGPPLKGILWECTAVPEIRVQAQRLAQELVSN